MLAFTFSAFILFMYTAKNQDSLFYYIIFLTVYTEQFAFYMYYKNEIVYIIIVVHCTLTRPLDVCHIVCFFEKQTDHISGLLERGIVQARGPG